MLKFITDKLDKKLLDIAGPVGEHGNNFGTAEEWKAYRERCESLSPKLYKITEFLDSIDIYFSVRYRRYILDPKYFFKNIFVHPMWFTRPRTMKIGQWTDTDTRILHTNMQMLVEFIEHENFYGDSKTGLDINDYKPWEVIEWEKKQRGEPNIIDPSDDDDHGMPEHQWQSMKTAWEIYLWWKNYDNRLKDIDDVYNDIPKDSTDRKHVLDMFTVENMKMRKPWHDKHQELEEKLNQEETDNLIALINIRKSLWT